jgi:hypothetical protein
MPDYGACVSVASGGEVVVELPSGMVAFECGARRRASGRVAAAKVRRLQ